MKKLIILFTLLFISTNIFSQNMVQNNTALERIETKTINNSIQIDVFFSEPINPQTISSATIFIDEKKINSNTKFIFNREGTQVRFLIDFTENFCIRFQDIKTINQKIISTESIYLNGATQWKKS